MTNNRLWAGRTSLSVHAGALRASLLVSLGLAPLACGGTTSSEPDGNGGTPARGGAPAQGGTPAQGGGGSSGASPSYAGAAGSGGSSTVALCQSPTVDPVTHLTRCSDGLLHRPEATACGAVSGEAGAGPFDASDAGAFIACTTNADCTALPLGYCGTKGGGVAEISQCLPGCRMDSDCGVGANCICDGKTPGRCTDAGCHVDADCGPGSLCVASLQVCGEALFQCSSPNDECRVPADCGGGTCAFDGGKRACNNAVCGRPFLVAEAPRLASIAVRRDWLKAGIIPVLSELSALERAALAAHWARLGQMEHASIAAFARFNMQLLALGAPGELVEACNSALADETAHTRLCFSLASQYGGTHIGPGTLEVRGSLEDVSLMAIIKLVVREGCLGETVASLEALEAASLATDPAVKSVLSQIAQDEQSHAELGFKFLRWALGECSANERAELALKAAQSLAEFERSAQAAGTSQQTEVTAHGMLSSKQLRVVHLAAVNGVVRALLTALFDAQRFRHCAEPGVDAMTA